MQQENSVRTPAKNSGFLDYLLYTLAGGVLAVFSFSFLLWLRF